MKSLTTLFAAIVCTSSIFAWDAPTTSHSVLKATRTCEKIVPLNCKTDTCGEYCKAMQHRSRDKATKIAACLEACPTNCNIHLKAKNPYASKPGQFDILEALVRDRLMQCVAQHRDPHGTMTGRRKVNWWEALTPRYEAILRDAGMLNAAAAAANKASYSSLSGVGTNTGQAPALHPSTPATAQQKQFHMSQSKLDRARANLRATGKRRY